MVEFVLVFDVGCVVVVYFGVGLVDGFFGDDCVEMLGEFLYGFGVVFFDDYLFVL